MHSPAERLQRLLTAARSVCDAESTSGQSLRHIWQQTSGLSPESVELALSRSLELGPAADECAALLASVEAAPRAWVVLSANVFTSALRAVALAVASSERVYVKPSRRDPAFARALQAQAPELFQLVTELAPSAGDHVFAYGADATLATLRSRLPPGVRYFAHGSGMGIALITDAEAGLAAAAAMLALDIVLFDQRGCLSPRLVAVDATLDRTAFARLLANELSALELRYPQRNLSQEEQGELTWFREVAAYVGEALPAGRGVVGSFQAAEHIPIPPALRCISLVSAVDVAHVFAPFQESITTVGLLGTRLVPAVQRQFPGARIAQLGSMQCPLFDGPVDRRTRPEWT